jgi:hypothetical protein
MATPIRIKRSAVPGKRPQVTDLQLGEVALNTFDAELYTLRDRFSQTGIGTEVVRIGAGVTVTNILYVTKDGNDNNTGKKLGDAKATIAAAVAVATEGDVIRVSAGTYVENNPIKLPKQLSIVGDSLREVTVIPQNSGDLFHVSPGNYVTEMSFSGPNVPGRAVFAFDPDAIQYHNQSPYIRNCTNFIPGSIGMKINGNHAIGPTKSMVTDSFTQYNQGGIGVSITNEGYAQLVSLFTICDDIAIFCGSGGACDLTNSNASFGNYALVADGVGPEKYVGIVTVAASVGSDEITLNLNTPTLNIVNAYYDNVSGLLTAYTDQPHKFSVGMGITLAGLGFTCPSGPGIVTYPSGNNGYIFNISNISSSTSFETYVGISTLSHTYNSGGTAKINVVRPFDGQVVYFGDLYYTVGKITVSAGGTGYTGNAEIIVDEPLTDWGITATAVAEVRDGSVTNVEIISNGRGYTTTPTVTVSAPNVGINTAEVSVEILPSYYSVLSSTPISSGICTITINDNLPFNVGVGTTVHFFKQSRILASGHSLEYIGSGTDITKALPTQGGIPIQENETDMRNGGLVVFTSTDQSGNFRIGDGVVINQQTGTISGNFYSKSLFSTVTPFILALGGD